MRTRHRASTIVALLLLCVPGARADLLDEEAVARIRPVIPAAIEFYAARSEDPLPALGQDQVEALLRGEVVRIRRRRPDQTEDPPERVTGYRLVALPRNQVWVAALDPEFGASDLLIERRLGSDGAGSSLWHQYLSLPWPIQDRQWVIRVRTRDDVARATDNLVWEQAWSLAENGVEIARESIASGQLGTVTAESARAAVYVPANEGSWVLFRIEPGITLIGYRVIARVGGSIPDSWIATFGMAQLGELLDGVARHAEEVPRLHEPGALPMPGGDGKPILNWR